MNDLTKALQTRGTWDDLLRTYFETGFREVKGWVDPLIFSSLRCIQEIHDELNLLGRIVEIGVYHGRFFLALDCLRRPGEPASAIDIFEEQELNIDGSGVGADQETFQRNFATYSQSAAPPDIHQIDSLLIDPYFTAKNLSSPRARLFSIDGGHTSEHAFNDMQIAALALAHGGVVFVDDYYHPHWPGVHQGVARYMFFANAKLAPFAYSGNKLMLTTVLMHEQVISLFEKKIRKLLENRVGNIKLVEMYGFKTIVVK
ncbi:MAG: class I SAM-dependent methyltransferase [Gammaproteobacteria bacterium]|nr:class I SAM-dependent methyltransferase [Gammaproteobacteria bacterium]